MKIVVALGMQPLEACKSLPKSSTKAETLPQNLGSFFGNAHRDVIVQDVIAWLQN